MVALILWVPTTPSNPVGAENPNWIADQDF
jgi:hypothetical protein